MKTTEKCYLLHINYTGWLLGGGRWVKSNGGWKLGSLKQQEELSNNFFSQHTAERLFSGRDLVLTGAALPLKLGGWVVAPRGEGRGFREVHMYMLHLTAK